MRRARIASDALNLMTMTTSPLRRKSLWMHRKTTWGMQVWCAHTPLQLGATIQDCSTRQQPSFVIINVSIYSRVLYIWYLLHYYKDWHSTLFKNKVENKNYLSIHVVFCSQYFVSGDISHWGGDIAVVDNDDLVGVALGKIGESGVFRGVPRIIWLIMNNVIVP